MRECPECGKETAENQTMCSFCRTDFTLPESIARIGGVGGEAIEAAREEEETARRLEEERLAIERDQGGFCSDCRYFRRSHEEEGRGACVRYPPQVGVTTARYTVPDAHSFFPEVADRGWCGEFVRMTADD